MGNILYEMTYRLDNSTYIPFIVLFGFLLFFIKEIIAIRLEKSLRGHWVSICILPLVLIIIIAVCGITVSTQIDMYNNIAVVYREGQYETVEGYVENFVPMPYEGHAQESFEINGVYFEYSDYSSLPGYHNAKSHGGVIIGDGQHLNIRYIYYEPRDCNVIVYIEEIGS